MNVLQEGEKKEELNKNKFFDTPSCMGWDIISLEWAGHTDLLQKREYAKGKRGYFTLENPSRHNLSQVIKS